LLLNENFSTDHSDVDLSGDDFHEQFWIGARDAKARVYRLRQLPDEPRQGMQLPEKVGRRLLLQLEVNRFPKQMARL
jgi:hypothetical protein